MQYKHLTEQDLANIKLRKMVELEAEHARLDLELRLADATGVANPSVEEGRGQLNILAAQMAALGSWIGGPDPADDLELVAASNGVGG